MACHKAILQKTSQEIESSNLRELHWSWVLRKSLASKILWKKKIPRRKRLHSKLQLSAFAFFFPWGGLWYSRSHRVKLLNKQPCWLKVSTNRMLSFKSPKSKAVNSTWQYRDPPFRIGNTSTNGGCSITMLVCGSVAQKKLAKTCCLLHVHRNSNERK